MTRRRAAWLAVVAAVAAIGLVPTAASATRGTAAQPDLVFIVRTTCIVNAGQDACRSGSDSRNTNVLRKRHGQWLQTSFQNTRIDPLP
jgi:hypothetical protein